MLLHMLVLFAIPDPGSTVVCARFDDSAGACISPSFGSREGCSSAATTMVNVFFPLLHHFIPSLFSFLLSCTVLVVFLFLLSSL
ncbi:unnamed protein product [Urochloa humidicola]